MMQSFITDEDKFLFWKFQFLIQLVEKTFTEIKYGSSRKVTS